MQHAPAKLLTFAIGRQRFGLRLDRVQEIIQSVRLARLPTAPQIVEGLVDLRGTVVPVLDVRSRFCMPSKAIEPSDHIVIAQANEHVVGIRVDRAIDVLTLPEHDIEDVSAASASEYVAGVVKLPDGLLFIHDLATFLTEAEADALDDVVEERRPS